MKKILFIFVLFISSSIYLHARCGETLEQLEARFGKWSKPTTLSTDKQPYDEFYSFSKNGVDIFAYMIGGKCERIRYFNSKGFKDEEVMTLLNLNKQKALWEPLVAPRRFDGKKDPLPTKSWQSEDLKFFAEKYGYNTLIIYSKTYLDRQIQLDKSSKEEKEKKAASSKLDGF